MKTTVIHPDLKSLEGVLPSVVRQLSDDVVGRYVEIKNNLKVLSSHAEDKPREFHAALCYRMQVVVSPSQYGSYHISELKNSKIISFVNDEGRMFLAPFSNSRLNELVAAGYKSGFISIPVFDDQFPGRIQGDVRTQYLLLENITRNEHFNEVREQFLNLLKAGRMKLAFGQSLALIEIGSASME